MVKSIIGPEGYSTTIHDRFWSKVEKTEGCWLWRGSFHRGGYGSIARGGRNGGKTLAHIVSWFIHFGVVPHGLCVLHRCDNPACVRPDHLFLGTRLDNSRDMVNKKRSPYGERSGTHILSETQVHQIRTEYIPRKVTQKFLALKYGVNRETINAIIRRKTWKHI